MERSLGVVLFGVVVMLHTEPSVQQMMLAPDHIIQELTHYGTEKLGEEVTKLQKAYEASYAAFKPVNNSCNGVLQTKTDHCYSCVSTSCKNRTGMAEKACRPNEWEALLGKGIKFFSKDVPKLLENSFKHVFVDELGKAVVNVGAHLEDFVKGPVKNLVGDIGKTVVKGVGDVGKTVIKGVVDVGKGIGHVGEEIGHGVVNVGEDLGHGVVHLGKEIGHGISHIGDEIGKGVNHVIHEIGHIFGKRVVNGHVVIVPRAASEPGCDTIKGSNGCDYYYDTCADCTLNPDADCPGYKAAIDKLKATYKAQSWLNEVKDWTYHVISVRIDGGSFDPATVGYKKVDVKVAILGKTLSFSMSHPVNPFNPVSAAPAIASQAMKLREKA